MKILRYWLVFMIMTVSVSCGGSSDDAPATVAGAEAALANGDVAGAVGLCNRLCSSADTTGLGWRDYCRLATIYAVAYDQNIEAEASMSAAARCYGKAVALKPDSAAAFMPAEEHYSVFQTVRHVFDGLTMDPADIRDHEEYTVEDAGDETKQ